MSDDIYTNLHSEPKNEQIVMIKKYQLSLCDNNHCAASLLNFFAYWHKFKLKQQLKNKKANDVAETYGSRRSQDESLYQWHTEKEISDGILNLFGESTIRKAIGLLQNKGIITIHNNPNPKFKFDKTNHYLYHVDVVDEYLKTYNSTDTLNLRNEAVKNNCSDVKSKAAITEITNTKTTNSFINKTNEGDSPNLHSKANKIREACKRRKQELPETEESILDNLDPNIKRIFEHWIECGLVKHKVGNKTFLSIVHKLELAISGKLFRGVEGFEKYATKKFMRKEILDSITALSNSAFSLEYAPSTQKSKEYLQKMSFDMFLYNPNGADRKHQSFFIHYLENGAQRVSELTVKKLAAKDTHPDITKMLTDWYSSFVMKGNNGHYTPSEMNMFMTSAERIHNFDYSRIYALQNLKFTMRCSEPYEVVTKLFLKMLEEQVTERDAKVTPIWFASDITFNEQFPKFLRERNYISEKRY